ncbi:unnamed protein product [Rhizophagus irregularis]|nr:unnamed protein product [Rhizophagus irregularis]
MKISCSQQQHQHQLHQQHLQQHHQQYQQQQQSIYKPQSQYYPEFGRNYRPFRLQYPYEDEQLPRLQYCPGVHILKRRQQSQSTRQAEIINLEEEQ